MNSTKARMLSLDAATCDCFNAIIDLRRLRLRLEPAQAQRHMYSHIDRMMGRLLACGVGHLDAQAVNFAITALADEIATQIPGPLATFWQQRPLQRHYFNETQGAKHFYTRLGVVKAKRHVLRVYMQCLALGFVGERQAASERESLFATLLPAAQLTEGAPQYDVEDFLPKRAWHPLWLPVGTVLLAAALYLATGLLQTAAANQTIHWVHSLLQGAA